MSPKTEVKTLFLGACILLLRRILSVSPMTEVGAGLGNRQTSFFGEWLLGSPMTEVRDPVFGPVSSVFGEAVCVSPNMEVKPLFLGSVTSFFGDP